MYHSIDDLPRHECSHPGNQPAKAGSSVAVADGPCRGHGHWNSDGRSFRNALRHREERPAAGKSLWPFEPDDAVVAGDIRAELERAGTPIGPYDILIAAQARRRGAVLITANRGEFARVSGLRTEDWASV
jgi:tRNA(fMet)-specific endonuclease VapC